MHALLIYESMFGHTRDIAWAVAVGLRARMDVDLVEVGSAGAIVRSAAGGPAT